MKAFCHPRDYEDVMEKILNSSHPDMEVVQDWDVRPGIIYFIPTKRIFNYKSPPV